MEPVGSGVKSRESFMDAGRWRVTLREGGFGLDAILATVSGEKSGLPVRNPG